MESSQGQFVNQSSFKTNISICVPSLERVFESYKRKANLFVACLWELQRYICDYDSGLIIGTLWPCGLHRM